MDVIAMNVTNSVASFGNTTGLEWMFTIAVFLTICGMLFIAFRNFRKLVYGVPITIGATIVYKISRWIGVSASQQDYVPVTWLIYLVIFIAISIIIGHFLSKTKSVKKWEKEWIQQQEGKK